MRRRGSEYAVMGSEAPGHLRKQTLMRWQYLGTRRRLAGMGMATNERRRTWFTRTWRPKRTTAANKPKAMNSLFAETHALWCTGPQMMAPPDLTFLVGEGVDGAMAICRGA